MLLVKGGRVRITLRSSDGGRKDKDTKGEKGAHVPGWVTGGFGGDAADFLGIHDGRLMMEVLDTKDLRFWKESKQALASTFSLHPSSLPPPRK